MVVQQLYEPLSSSDNALPLLPPEYENLEDDDADLGNASGTGDNTIEQFEIDDTYFDEPVEREGFLVRASLMTKKLANNLNNKIIHPVSRMIDPMYEGYQYFQQQYEKSILKIGNPLVVKRLFYLFFILVIVFFVTRYTVSDGVNGASGGAFSNGKLYDIDKLASTIRGDIDVKVMKENLEYLSSMPHLTGSKGDLTLAKYVESYMKNNGIKLMELNELQSFINYPNSNKDETYVKLSDGSHDAELYELNNEDMQYLAYNPNSLSTSDEIESHYIYGNYGSLQDFQKLKEKGVPLKDAILLIKYGGPEGTAPDANKVQMAQTYGVKAIIFITPETEWNGEKHDDVIQKENVGLTRISPGDILTPGWSSEDGYATRLPWFKSETTPKLPTIPISWKDGQKFLHKLEKGIKFSDGYSGVGEGVKIKLKISNKERPTHKIWNVVGSIQGREQAEKGVIIGAGRDSTCFGTMSTNTGTAVLLEMIKIFTSLQRQYNWNPSRSIYFVSFDATEYNLAGLSEWVESRKEQLRKQGYAYIDLSDVVTGDELSVNAHPFLHDLIKQSLQKVKSDISKRDDTNNNNLDMYELYKQQHNDKDDIGYDMIEQKNYIPFINLINVPSLEIKFTGKKYPKNTCFDNFDNFEKSQIDPSMTKHRQIVELISIIALNLAESPIIPYNFNDLSFRLLQYEKDLEFYAQQIISSLDQPNIPKMNFAPLIGAIALVRDTGARVQSWRDKWKTYVSESADIEPALLAMNRWKWNDKIVEFNELFISTDIKPARPGYLNTLFGVAYNAPAKPDGQHQWNSFPKVRDYLFYHDFGRAQMEIANLATLLLKFSDDFFEG